MLAVGMRSNERLESGNDAFVPAQLELEAEQLLASSELELLQTGRGLERKRLECQVFERLPADGGKSVPQARRALGRGLVRPFEQALEPERVDLIGSDTE